MQKMKAITAVCSTGASVPAISANGRISRNNHPHRNGDGENTEMKMYLSKLKDLVPFMPKNRKLSKLEIIQNVIDYICDLQSELETHPAINGFDAAAALNFHSQQQQQEIYDERISNQLNIESSMNSSQSTRQPLVDRQSPNTILSTSHNNPVVSSIVINGNSLSTQHSHATAESKQSVDNSRSNC